MLLRWKACAAARGRGVGLCALAALGATPAAAASLTVGPGQAYATIAAAVAASRDGDTVVVLPGTYVDDYAEIRTRITLRGTAGRTVLKATTNSPNRKGILLTDTDITISGLTFTGARVSDDDGGNGAGIRYQGGNLTVSNCYFYNNQEGLLGNADPSGSVTVLGSEFNHNGTSSGPSAGYTHNLYVGAVARLQIDGSYFHHANIGHQIKSRAQATTISNSRVVDGYSGTGSYSIDLPNGGRATILDNQIQQGPNSQNPAIIAYGEEGGVPGGAFLSVSGNVIANELASGSARAVLNPSGVTASVTGNSVFGLAASQIASGPASVSGTVFLAQEPVIATTHPWIR